ncbi:galactose oxidase [Paramuricea clavata]|uniref:Galactose oxidase n=1 Tax=Paramuricea clavata TaxID=317549 RepID=A0A7D9J4P1_PARCT|nr:galactose oxidase [Paramuricea clavata]
MDTVKTTLAEMNEKLDDNFKAIQDKFESMEKQQEKLSRHKFEDTKSRVVVVAGGWNKDSRELNSVELFDSSKGTWSYLQPMKECRENASAFVYNKQIIVSGGWTKSNGRSLQTNLMEALQNANQISSLSTWNNFPAKLSGKLSGFSTVVYNDSLIVVGGFDGSFYSGNISEVSLVHPYAIKMLTKMLQGISMHAVELFGDKIVIIGGHTTQSINNVLMYDIKKNKCEELAPLPYPVQNMATVKWADNVIVIGGQENLFVPFNTVIIYNVKTQQSHWLPPMIYKRSGCTAAVVDNSHNTIIVMGGQDEKRNILNSVERFSFTYYTWEELPSMHEARRYAISVVC